LKLKLEVFKAETKLQGFGGQNKVYNFAAVDAAGNSGLHYAAAAGAGLEICSALIDSGVDPYQINTAGQLFLHCLRPDTNTPDWDKTTGTVEFQLELINFLNSLQLLVGKCAFRWRDNEGRTAMDSYILQIADENLREQTLR
jgi:ankyrin repeat protein